MSALDAAARTASSAGGQILRAVTRLVAVRPAAKPLHPGGSVVRGTLRRFGGEVSSGARWLDQPGVDEVLVRQSRAVGLPPPAPDIFGLAVRVPTGDREHGDLLFASTGLGRLTRFMLRPTRSPQGRPMTTLLPYKAPLGPLLLSAVFSDDASISLAWAVRTGDWHPFAELHLFPDDTADSGRWSRSRPLERDALLSFDPVSNELPGLENYDWVRRLREPSYGTARRSRRTRG